jgi:hypothetical protein
MCEAVARGGKRDRLADSVVETVDVSADDERYLKSLGFEPLENGMRLQRSASVARRDVVGREVWG